MEEQIKLPKIISKEKINKFFRSFSLNSFDNKFHYYLFRLMAFSGIRICEVLQIKIDNINFKHNYIYIKKTKNGREFLAVPHPKIMEEIKVWIKDLKERYPNTPYLFPTFAKEDTAKGTLRKRFKEHLKKAGIEEKYYPYSLRHSFATHLYEQDVPIEKISRLLNHKNTETTKIYICCATQNLIPEVSKLEII